MLRRHTFAFFSGCMISSLLVGCKVSSPDRVESAVIRWTKHNITVGGVRDKNPIEDTAEDVETGKRVFGFYCVVCHGRDGQNTGVPFANKTFPPIPSLASADTQQYTDGQLRWIIKNGIGPSGMPASRGVLSDTDIWTIVVYLRHLPPQGSLGEPRAYSGDEYER